MLYGHFPVVRFDLSERLSYNSQKIPPPITVLLHTNLGLAEVGGGGGARLSWEDDEEDSSSSSGEEGDPALPAPEWLAAPPIKEGEESAREAVPLLDSFLGRRTG